MSSFVVIGVHSVFVKNSPPHTSVGEILHTDTSHRSSERTMSLCTCDSFELMFSLQTAICGFNPRLHFRPAANQLSVCIPPGFSLRLCLVPSANQLPVSYNGSLVTVCKYIANICFTEYASFGVFFAECKAVDGNGLVHTCIDLCRCELVLELPRHTMAKSCGSRANYALGEVSLKGSPCFLTEGHMSMTKSGLACVYCV